MAFKVSGSTHGQRSPRQKDLPNPWLISSEERKWIQSPYSSTIGSSLTSPSPCFPGACKRKGSPSSWCGEGLAAPSIPAALAQLQVPPCLREPWGQERACGMSSERPQSGRRDAGEAGRARGGERRGGAGLAGAGSATGRPAAARGGRSPAPPRPSPPRPAASCRSRPAASGPARSPLCGPARAAMAQHFSLAACDVVGFDLDHTLCRYNLPESAPVSGARGPGRPERSLRSCRGWSSLPAQAARCRGPAVAAPLRGSTPGPHPVRWARADGRQVGEPVTEEKGGGGEGRTHWARSGRGNSS